MKGRSCIQALIVTLQVAKDLSPSFAALQPALARPGLQACYHLPFEFARAVRGGVQRLLREHLLPRLAAQVRQCAR